MYLKVHHDDRLTLEDQDNFRVFHIEGEKNDIFGPDLNSEFSRISERAEETRFWLDATEIIRVAGRLSDDDWKRTFWSMLEMAEPYGFADTKMKRIRAHVQDGS